MQDLKTSNSKSLKFDFSDFLFWAWGTWGPAYPIGGRCAPPCPVALESSLYIDD